MSDVTYVHWTEANPVEVIRVDRWPDGPLRNVDFIVWAPPPLAFELSVDEIRHALAGIPSAPPTPQGRAG